MHMTKLKKLGAGLLVIAFAASCSIATSMDATIDREIEAATKLKEDSKIPTAPSNEDLIKVKDEIWLGDTSEVEYEGDPLPSYLETKNGITLVSNRPITLFEIGDMINKITGMRVSYATHLEKEVLSNGAKNKPTCLLYTSDAADEL